MTLRKDCKCTCHVAPHAVVHVHPCCGSGSDGWPDEVVLPNERDPYKIITLFGNDKPIKPTDVLPHMTPDEARHLVIEGMNYAAYHETDYSLYDSDKNRLFGSEQYKSGRPVYEPSPWAEGEFEEKMAMLLVWANVLNRSVPAFTEAQRLLEGEDSVVGRVIRSAKNRKTTDTAPGTKFSRS